MLHLLVLKLVLRALEQAALALQAAQQLLVQQVRAALQLALAVLQPQQVVSVQARLQRVQQQPLLWGLGLPPQPMTTKQQQQPAQAQAPAHTSLLLA
jgi:hypothetical protein